MPAIRITQPGGIVPRYGARQLPGDSAQAAANVSMLSGEWQPMRKAKELWSPSLAQALQSIFRLDDTTWLGWAQAGVNMERTAIEGESRFAYTGDGVPKITTKTLASPVTASGNPAAARTLGIPAPQAAPTLGHAGGTGAAVTRFYVYTFYSDWNEESAPSLVSPVVTGKVDGTWTVGGMDPSPPNTGAITGAAYSAGFVTVTFSATNHYARGSDQITIAGIVGMTDLNGVWTIDSSPAPNQVKIALVTAQAYTCGGTWTRLNPWGACTKRIYRTAGTKADFQMVVKDIPSGTTSYADTLLDAAIPGDSLLSQTWAPPPVNMIGLVAMQNGVLAGWINGGRTIYFSEPYQPHAWPDNYKKKVQADIVGIAPFDANLGVATKGLPSIFSGYEPAQMSVTQHNKPFPALSRYSVSSAPDGIVFATKNGLARMDLSGVGMLTDALFTPEAWNALAPASMQCAYDGTRLYFYTTTSPKRMFILNMAEGGAMVNAYQPVDAMRADPMTGDLYFAYGKKAYVFDSFDTAPMTIDWWSKEYLIDFPVNMGAAKVEYDESYSASALAAMAAERAAAIAANAANMALPAGGRGAYGARAWNSIEFNGSILGSVPDTSLFTSFTLYANGKVVCTKTVTSQKGFTLPSGYKADNFSVRIQSNTLIRAVVIADTPKSLADA